MNLPLFRESEAIDSPRNVRYPVRNIVEITSNPPEIGLRLDFSNGRDRPQNHPGEFSFFNASSGEPVRVTEEDASSWFGTDNIAWKIRKLFTQDEVDDGRMRFDQYQMPAEKRDQPGIRVLFITFKPRMRHSTDVFPNESLSGIAFRLKPGDKGLLKGEIYPLLIPEAVDHEVQGARTMHNGKLILTDQTELTRWTEDVKQFMSSLDRK